MKFCKDCVNYSKAFSCGAFGVSFSVPAACGHGDHRDPVTGDRRIAGLCDGLRADESKCGAAAAWFMPANLDGRLAMLESKSEL